MMLSPLRLVLLLICASYTVVLGSNETEHKVKPGDLKFLKFVTGPRLTCRPVEECPPTDSVLCHFDGEAGDLTAWNCYSMPGGLDLRQTASYVDIWCPRADDMIVTGSCSLTYSMKHDAQDSSIFTPKTYFLVVLILFVVAIFVSLIRGL